jgi:hypothetical protein
VLNLRFRSIGIGLVLGIAVLAAKPATAGFLSLAYDNPVLNVAPGGSVEIGATLTVEAGSGLTLNTDANGMWGAIVGLFPMQGAAINIAVCSTSAICKAEFPFQMNSIFTPTSPNPLGNLFVPEGQSVHLDLGTIAIDTTMAPGTYTTDIGIGESFDFEGGGGICSCSQMVSAYAPPDIDAGPLTIVVGNDDPVTFSAADRIPEPPATGLLAMAFIGLAIARRKSRLA